MSEQTGGQVKKKPSDFVFGKVIGEGSYSTVSFDMFQIFLKYVAVSYVGCVTSRCNQP